MSTYSDHQQRELDAASGAEMDRRAASRPIPENGALLGPEAMRERMAAIERNRPTATAPDPNSILRLLISSHVPHPDALELLRQALDAEYARGRVDGAREMGDRLSQATEQGRLADSAARPDAERLTGRWMKP